MAEQTDMLNFIEATRAAYIEEMRRDERVVIWGEDVAAMRGSFRETGSILDEFGPDRIMDTPIVESAIVGMAVGAALTGFRPIAFIGFVGLLPCCFDAIYFKVGAYGQKTGYRGQYCERGPLPLVIQSMVMGGRGTGFDHDSSLEALLIHNPGLKVVMPSTPYDAKGLMKTAIRDDEPVIFLTHMVLNYGEKQAIPSEEYLIPLGQADVKREGKDVTIVAYSQMVLKALAAAEELSKEGISVEVVDLRSLVPLDIETIVKSVKKTGCLLIVHEAIKRGGVAGEIAFRVSEAAPDVVKTMKIPIRRLATKNVWLPIGVELEKMLVPQVDDIVKAVKEMV